MHKLDVKWRKDTVALMATVSPQLSKLNRKLLLGPVGPNQVRLARHVRELRQELIRFLDETSPNQGPEADSQ